MEIYIARGDQEYGPYTREQIFAFMRDGYIVEGDWARTPASEDWQHLKEVLERGSINFFDVETHGCPVEEFLTFG